MSSREYTSDERYKIIRYILDNKRFSGLKGITIWKEIEKAKLLDRTWQSMRTHFKGKIINVLHHFNITENDRQLILSGWSRKTLQRNTPYKIAGFPEANHRFSFSSDSDSDTTVRSLNIKQNETRRKRLKSDNATTSTAPDLVLQGSNVSEKELISKKPICDSHESNTIDVVVIDDSDENTNENTNDANSVSFSLEEDMEIINFFKENELYLDNIYDQNVYQIIQALYSSNRSCESLKNRFVGYILPNLYKYKCLTYGEMIQYYDKTEIDVPAELQSKIHEILLKHSKKSATLYDSCTNTSKVLTTDDASTQISDPATDSDKFKIYTTGKYIGITLDGSVHIFLPKRLETYGPDIKSLQDRFNIPEENFHIVDIESYSRLSAINCTGFMLQKELNLLMNGYLQSKVFDISNMLPLMDKMKLIIQTMSDSVKDTETMDTDETFCNLFEDPQENQREVNENSVLSEQSVLNVCDLSDSIIPSTPESENLLIPAVHNTDVLKDSEEKELTFDVFKNQIDKMHASTQSSATQDVNSKDDLHERSSELSLQSTVEFCRPGTVENESIVSNSTDTNLTNPRLTEFTASDESTRNLTQISNTSDSEKLTALPYVNSEMGPENEQRFNSSELQMPGTCDTFYSACSSLNLYTQK